MRQRCRTPPGDTHAVPHGPANLLSNAGANGQGNATEAYLVAWNAWRSAVAGLSVGGRRPGRHARRRGSDPVYPLLVLEDLSEADWDVRWDAGRVALVRAALDELARSQPPPNTRRVRETVPSLFGSWRTVEQDPGPFLSTQIRSRSWLGHALPRLIEAADAVAAEGDELLHLDVRSDNVCFRDGSALLIDWNWCSTGPAELDVASWLPSLALEGGPQPWEVLPRAGEYAALLAGFFAALVGLPPPATAPTVRALQRSQLEVALAWCEHELGV